MANFVELWLHNGSKKIDINMEMVCSVQVLSSGVTHIDMASGNAVDIPANEADKFFDALRKHYQPGQ